MSMLASFSLLYVSVEMEALPLVLSRFLSFDLFVKCCNLCLVFILSVTSFSSYCGAWQPEYKPPFNVSCGSGALFLYPFGWRNSGCGDPLLQLHCDNNNTDMPLLDIDCAQYYVLEYFEYNPLNLSQGIEMTIIDKNLMGKKCDPSSSNSTMQFWSAGQLRIVDGYQNITLWEGCQNDTRLFSNVLFKLGCNASFYYNTFSDMSWTEKCKSQVQLPVRKYLDPGPNLTSIIKEGFKIKWTPSNNCKQCMSNKGMCAYNANIKSNTSICKPWPDKCWGNNSDHEDNDSEHADNESKNAAKSSNSNAVLRDCSITGAVVVAICVFVFSIYYKKRRKTQPIRGILGINTNPQRRDMEAVVGNLPIFTYEELHQATNCFHENKKLGDGGFGSVYLGNLKDGRTVAVKRLYQQNSRIIELFINEVKILSSLLHPNLVQLYGCTYPQSPVLLLVYEFIPNGTLADHIHGSRKDAKSLPWEIRLNIAIETAQALSFLHSVNPPIFHRDVKSTNILLDENFRTKVADFGLSRLVPVNVSHVSTAPQGSPGYLDPEYQQCFQLTEKSDVYSFGVVLIELISAKLAVDTTRNKNEISLANMAIEKIREGALHELVDPDLKTETNHDVKAMVSAVAELAFRCLARDGDLRPDMKEVADRLEEIRLQFDKSDSEPQSSTGKEYSIKLPVSPTSVHEGWPSIASENSV